MRATICDACAKIYKPYANHYQPEDKSYDIDVNGISFIRVDGAGKLHGKGKIELCPECMNKAVNYIFTELVGENAPFIDRLKFYEENKKNSAKKDEEQA